MIFSCEFMSFATVVVGIQSQAGNVTAVVIHEPDQVGVATRQPERHDVALPQLVGAGPFEEPRLGWILHRLASRRVHQPLLGQRFMDRGLTRGNQKKSFEDIGNPSWTVFRMSLLHRHHPLTNIGRHPGGATGARLYLQSLDCVIGFYTRECHPIFSDPQCHKLEIRTSEHSRCPVNAYVGRRPNR